MSTFLLFSICATYCTLSQRLRRIRESAYGFARSSASLPGFPAGRTDCHTSAIQAAYPSPRLFRRKSQGSVTPLHRLLRAAQVRPGSIWHWLAMTCRRQKGVCVCKDVARNAMQKEGRVRGCKDAARKARGNMPGVSGGKALVRNDTSPLSLRGAKRRDNPHPRREGQEKVALRANS